MLGNGKISLRAQQVKRVKDWLKKLKQEEQQDLENKIVPLVNSMLPGSAGTSISTIPMWTTTTGTATTASSTYTMTGTTSTIPSYAGYTIPVTSPIPVPGYGYG